MHFVHTADNHLDAPLSVLPPDKKVLRRAQRLSSFSKIIDFTIYNNADMLLISGDLFDSPTPDSSVLKFCTSEFERLGNIPVFISAGNHDYGINKYNFPGNVHIFPEHIETLEYKDYAITGASFSSAVADFSTKIPSVQNKDKLNILCIHGDIFSRSEYNPLNKDFLSTLGYDYIAMGHVHYYHDYKNIVYPGCHDGSGFDESGTKGFLYCELDKNYTKKQFINSSSLVYDTIDFDISDYSSSLDIANAIEECLSDGIYKINLTGSVKEDFSPNIDFIESHVSEKVFFVKIQNITKPNINFTNTRLYQLFSDYIASHCDEDIASLALQYGISALKGDDL